MTLDVQTTKALVENIKAYLAADPTSDAEWDECVERLEAIQHMLQDIIGAEKSIWAESNNHYLPPNIDLSE